jgi:hypothetical protein
MVVHVNMWENSVCRICHLLDDLKNYIDIAMARVVVSLETYFICSYLKIETTCRSLL